MASLMCFTWLILGAVLVEGMEIISSGSSATRTTFGGSRIAKEAGPEELASSLAQKANPVSLKNPIEEGGSLGRGERSETLKPLPTPSGFTRWTGRAKESFYKMMDRITESLKRLFPKKDPLLSLSPRSCDAT
ncbi:uncharacterized protein PGTG_22208 [Puccinia graminis f. sp. tritici CRL 75-36-700-3]|uniref:Uncharacterized protein n=1 Tax=Puccinia graminis f. sp. tritici (strain CRL 75-36-700-3 / race SCCL) TaxID=418459 RepID=H6QTS3_PUCGT|nr:uncharacterized protein PGTG_22208 [Puccinia graminis f. sp. tritici CRL 75-36-700-3]EHS64337.1 hypothetical protein PGTG_22208 [Puccinia graminis f. sp. tritici CRL 75-36-700-3]